MSRLLATLLLAWGLGFALFASTLPRPATDETTDGIVVLTGGPGRVQRGLALLAAGRGRRLLVSGVEQRVRRGEFFAVYRVPPRLRALVDLGREAVDTRSNADEAAGWARVNGYRSIRLVTTDWHMPRARLELSVALGSDTSIVSDAVRSEPGLIALLREYDKYLLRRGAALYDAGRALAAETMGHRLPAA